MIIRILAENYIMLFELIGLIMLLRMSSHVPPRVKRLTLVVIALLVSETVAYEVERWTQSFATLSLLRPMLTAYKYSVFPFILLGLTEVTANRERPTWQRWVCLTPATLAVPVYFTSQWTGLVCSFAPDNTYTGGLLPWLPYGIFLAYSGLFLFRNFQYFRTYSRTNRVTTAYIALMALVGVALYLYVLEDENFCGIFTSAILLYYLLIYIHLAQVDPLTKLLNRQSLYQDIVRLGNRITGAVSADMNDLKIINDTQGHPAGDAALVTVAQCLRDHCGNGGIPYRIGGDEFIILYLNTDGVLIEKSVHALRAALRQTPYTCALGYAVRPYNAPLRDCIRESDRQMYDDKAKIKAARARGKIEK